MNEPKKADYIRVWEFATGENEGRPIHLWLPAPELSSPQWLSDVLNGLRKNHDNIEVTINHKIVLFEDSETFERWMGVSPNLNEALLTACLKYMEAK